MSQPSARLPQMRIAPFTSWRDDTQLTHQPRTLAQPKVARRKPIGTRVHVVRGPTHTLQSNFLNCSRR